MAKLKKLWRTRLEPLEDITAYELALDRANINGSEIVGSWDAERMGTALRHRVSTDDGRRMDVVYAEWKAQQESNQ